MGTHLCNALVGRGHPVRVFERPVPEALSAERARGPIEWLYGAFVNRNDIASAIDGCDVSFTSYRLRCPRTQTKIRCTTSKPILPGP